MPVKKIFLAKDIKVYSFAQNKSNRNNIFIGTNRGVFSYNKKTAQSENLFADGMQDITVTDMEVGKDGNIWFSTLERGMGYYFKQNKSIQFFPYPKKQITGSTQYAIANFCRKSPSEFFVAVLDSTPAIFNSKNMSYVFIDIPVFHSSPGGTSDIQTDKAGNLFIIKGGAFYYGNTAGDSLLAIAVANDSLTTAPFISSVKLRNGLEIFWTDEFPESLEQVDLKYDQNSFNVFFDVNDYSAKDKIQFAWKMDGLSNGWISLPSFIGEKGIFTSFENLKPGKYLFQLKVKVGSDWRKQEARLLIIVRPPYWQTWWFWVSVVAGISLFVGFMVNRRVRAVRKQERLKAQYEKEALELEAKALRAQMNPHFIFNCMNSIKSLIQQNNSDKAVVYLTTFSKLIRTIFQNSDARDISLFDEIETCRLYMQLESMRFDKKFSYAFHVDEKIDTKSMQVPALIIQPFIENAIWHGIMPKEGSGHISVLIEKKENAVYCIVDDNGIGRDMSKQYKFSADLSTHHSKGVYLAKSRLDIDNILSERNASVAIIDKKDEMGKSLGTKVTLTFNEY